MKYSIAKKLTSLVAVVVVVTAGILRISVNSEYEEILENLEIKIIGTLVNENAIKLETSFERLEEDIAFLSKTPPIMGIARARKNNGTDQKDGSTEAMWKQRLSEIFTAYIVSREFYKKISYLSVLDQGENLVTVGRENGNIKDINNDEKKTDYDLSEYRNIIEDGKAKIYFSTIATHGTDILKNGTSNADIKIVSPVFSEEGNVFAVIVLDISVDKLLQPSFFSQSSPEELSFNYTTNDKGVCLTKFLDGGGCQILKGNEKGVIQNYSKWESFFINSHLVSQAKRIKTNGAEMMVYARKAYIDKNARDKFIVFFHEEPYGKIAEKINKVENKNIFIGVIVLIGALIVTLIFSNKFTRPLNDIIRSLSDFKENKKVSKLNINTDDEIGRLASVFNDLIHDLEFAHDQLIQSEKMASIGQLAAGVAHEINNPVGFVGSNINSLKNYCEDLMYVLDRYEASDEYIEKNKNAWNDIKSAKEKVDIKFVKDDLNQLIKESLDGVKRVKDIVQDLKDFSHVDEAEWQWVNIHDGLDSTLNIVNNEIKYKAEVEKYYGNLPDINCLASQLNQVFMNLLVNAAHSIEEHGTITLKTGVKDNNWVWVSITDTGKGMSEETRKKIFDPFFTTKPVGQGTGLGLSLSYGIIDKHGGKIEVESKEGVGTEFKIWLPVNKPKEKE